MTLDSLREARLVDAVEAAAFADLYAAASEPLARSLGLRVARIAGAMLLHAPGIPLSMFNRAIGLGVHRTLTEADLDAAIASFRSAGYASYWIHHNPFAAPASLVEWLGARGFVAAARRSWAKMLRGPEPIADIDVDFEVRRSVAGEAEAIAEVVCSAFGMPKLFVPWMAALVDRPRWRAYAALDAGEIVGAGFLYLDGTTAWLGIGGVLPEMRGRNAHRALMALRIREAGAAGCTDIVTETGEAVGDEPNPSLANMYFCGFRRVCSRLNFEAKA
jgi:GNAT superfamily N-acetyltransferase